MLKQVNIQNFAIIDKMSIDFNQGLSVITGQTGAGKSIVIDAIEQLLGARALQAMVAENQEYAIIEGVFEYNDVIEKILNQHDILLDDDYLIINKRIKSDGKSQLKINNRIVTNDLIRQISPYLVEIHTQHATYLLNEQINQQKFIDNMFSKQETLLLNEYQDLYHNYQKMLNNKEDLVNNKIDPELLSFYQTQLSEITDNNIEQEELDTLNDQESYYKEFEKISNHLENAINVIQSKNISENINSINSELLKLSSINDTFSSLANKSDEIYYDLQDLLEQIKLEYYGLSFNQNEYDLIKERLYNYQKMIKKYSYSQEEVKSKLDDLTSKIDFINNSGTIISKLDKEIQEKHTELNSLASQLTAIRLKYIKDIEIKIKNHLNDLYLKDANFKIDLLDSPLNINGSNKVLFLFSANKGSSLKPINLVASGGELSRLMLALKTITAQENNKMYIFDEIDTGVSGQVADAIGLKIKEISKSNDVICITHLPQVAVYAKNHLFIAKSNDKQFTTSNCYYLDEEQQINEIATMLSGDLISETALQHAKELIKNAHSQN